MKKTLAYSLTLALLGTAAMGNDASAAMKGTKCPAHMPVTGGHKVGDTITDHGTSYVVNGNCEVIIKSGSVARANDIEPARLNGISKGTLVLVR